MGGPVGRSAPPYSWMGDEARFPDRARRPVWVPPDPLPFWVRHPHWTGIATAIALAALGLLLSGCECGVGWPCPR